MSQLPMEIINKILSYRERHPIARIISHLKDDLVCEAYEEYGGNYPDDSDDEEGEYTFDEMTEETLYEIACIVNYLKEIDDFDNDA